MRGKEKKKFQKCEEEEIEDDIKSSRGSAEMSERITQPPPLHSFQDTVILRKPLGLRINKATLAVTYVEPNGASAGKVSVGDKIVAIDRQKITTIDELNTLLRNSSAVVAVRFKRFYYSKCKHRRTFVEKISVEKDREMKCTGRAIDLYLVQMELRISDIVDAKEVLGLSVKYDNKERIQVVATADNSLSSVHLRPGDVIREVNGHPIASKTMLNHFIQEGVIENGQVSFTIESLAGGEDAYCDQVDVANDVLEIAQNQIAQFRAAVAANSGIQKSILHKQQTSQSKKSVVINDRVVELPICADYDPSKLKPCKNANAEMKTMQNK